MMPRGFYSVVQYCPDRFRAEAVNVGLVLLCIDPHAVRVRMTGNHERVRKLFAIARPELKNLKVSTLGLTNRIETSVKELRTSEDLAAFAGSRANDLRLTEPRLAMLDDIDADFERLFAQLVEKHKTAALAESCPAEVLPPVLGEVFYKLQRTHRIWKPGTITVPKSRRKLDVPYAYKNGIVNLILPKAFSETRRAETQAETLAISGDLIQKYPVDGERQKLIVVSTQETAKQSREIDEHVEPLFKEYGVRLIRPQHADEFAHEVEQSAH
jgi:hypothetical protein